MNSKQTEILKQIHFIEPRPISDVAAVYRVLTILWERSGSRRRCVSEGLALEAFRRHIQHRLRGNWEFASRPDYEDRMSKAPDGLLTSDSTPTRFVVEATQLLIDDNEVRDSFDFVDLAGGLAVRLEGKTEATISVVGPYFIPAGRRQREALLDELASMILGALDRLNPLEHAILTNGWGLMLESKSGASIALHRFKPPTGPRSKDRARVDIGSRAMQVLREASEKMQGFHDSIKCLVVGIRSASIETAQWADCLRWAHDRVSGIDCIYVMEKYAPETLISVVENW